MYQHFTFCDCHFNPSLPSCLLPWTLLFPYPRLAGLTSYCGTQESSWCLSWNLGALTSWTSNVFPTICTYIMHFLFRFQLVLLIMFAWVSTVEYRAVPEGISTSFAQMIVKVLIPSYLLRLCRPSIALFNRPPWVSSTMQCVQLHSDDREVQMLLMAGQGGHAISRNYL